jgi:hypothetical protein
MRGCLLVLVASCAVQAPARVQTHPATPTAPIGRLAGSPPALREGAITYPDVPPVRSEPAGEHHHHTP